jgi:hypothetical protein
VEQIVLMTMTMKMIEKMLAGAEKKERNKRRNET